MASRSTLPSAILALLAERPMHPYGIQQEIRHRRNHEVINVTQRATFYPAIKRLEREGLIRAQSVSRDARRPERTTYELTDTGRCEVASWIRRGLATPLKEYPEFPAVLSFLGHVSPEEARQGLRQRLDALDAEHARLGQSYAEAIEHGVARYCLVEIDFLRTACRSEHAWVTALIAELEAGTLTWSPQPPPTAPIPIGMLKPPD